MTPTQIFFPIIPPIIHKRHVLIHLLLGPFRHPAHGIFKGLLRNLLVSGPFPRLGLHLAESINDIGTGIVIRRGENPLSQRRVLVRQNRLDKFPGIVSGVEQRYRGRGRGGEGEDVFVGRWIGPHHAARDVGHVKPRHEEGGGDRECSDVFLDFGFGIEVFYPRKGALGYWGV